MSEAKLPPPVIPRNFYAAGLNYLAHIEWANSRGASHKVPAQPDGGIQAGGEPQAERSIAAPAPYSA